MIMVAHLKTRSPILLTLSLAILLAISIYGDIGFLRIASGFPYLFLLPGWLTLRVLSADHDLRSARRFASAIGVSLIILLAIGLGLNYSPWGLRLPGIYISITSYNILMAWVGSYRNESPSSKNVVQSISTLKLAWFNLTFIQRIALAASVLSIILIPSLLLIRINTIGTGERFTEFYILDSAGKLESSLLVVRPDQPTTVKLGIINREKQRALYRLEISISGQLLYTSEDILLPPDQTYEAAVSVIPTIPVDDGDKVLYHLYKDNNITPYRTLTSWVSYR